MRRFTLLLLFGLLATTSVVVAAPSDATQAQPRWVITDLGTLGGRESGVGGVATYETEFAGAINDHGQIVGWSDTKRGRAGFIWENGHMRALSLAAAVDINERGQVAGTVETTKGSRAALWENGRSRTLGTLTGSRCKWNEVAAINDAGQIVGYESVASDTDLTWRGFLWQRGALTDIGTLGGDITEATAITNHGQVVGTSWTTYDPPRQYSETHAFLWERGKMTDLGSRFHAADPARINESGQIPGFVEGGRPAIWVRGGVHVLPNAPGLRGVRAVDINDVGTVAGICTVGPGRRAHPCLWRDGKALDLGLDYGDQGSAVAVSDRGQVIGNSRPGNGRYHAFVWESGKMTDLGTLPGGEQSQALAINKRSQIIGWSETNSGSQHAVLWTLKR